MGFLLITYTFHARSLYSLNNQQDATTVIALVIPVHGVKTKLHVVNVLKIIKLLNVITLVKNVKTVEVNIMHLIKYATFIWNIFRKSTIF